MNSRRASVCLFLLGTFSLTQIHLVGNIGISELVVFFIAPFVFLQDYKVLKYDGFMPIVWLAVLTCVGCAISSVVNHTSFVNFMRGFASPYTIFSVLVVGHRLVRRSMGGFKWFCLGLALSLTINIFIFQRGVEADAWGGGERGMAAVEGIVGGPLFWISRLKAWLYVPITGWYLRTSSVYSVLTPLFLFFFAAITTASGRSAAATAIASVVLVLLGGKKRDRMRILMRNFWGMLIIGLVFINVLTWGYKYSATHGLMGEKALKKYELQMKGRKGGVLATLMGGRLEFFVGSYAALQKPFVGYGPWAIDYDGYYDQFLAKYGNADDYEEYLKLNDWQRRIGHSFISWIPAHSHIIGFWVWYGIFGFLFWLYVLWQIVRYFKCDLATVPQWFGMLAVGAPSMLWVMFFSPFGDRVSETMYIVLLMMTKAVRLGRVQLPPGMICEIEKADGAR